MFDKICQKYNLEKIKTIGDAYMAVGGVPTRTTDHAQSVADMALEAMESLKEFNQLNSLFHQELKIRIGLHTGPCIAGVVGKVKYVYDLYGDAVKMAAAMESTGVPGRIQVSEQTAEILKESFELQERGMIELKTYGYKKTYFLVARTSPAPMQLQPSPRKIPIKRNASVRPSESNFSIGIQNPHWKWINQDIEQLAKAKLHKLSLQFNLKSAEQNYHEYWFYRSIVAFRIGALINIFLLIVTSQDILAQYTLSGNLGIAERVVRFGILVGLWIFLFVLSFLLRLFKRTNEILVTSVIFVTGASIVIFGYFSHLMWFGLLGLYLSNFFLIKLRFQYALLVTAIIHIAFVIIALVTEGLEMLETVVFLFSIFFSSLGSSYYLETYSRKNFLEQQILTKEQERLTIEQSKSEELLVNLLPVSIAHQLKLLKSGHQTIASRFDEVSIIFVHIAGTSKLMRDFGLKEMFNYVNKIFCKFDEFTQARKLEKIKTIGSTYMVAGNLPTPLPNHVNAMIDLVFDMFNFLKQFSEETGLNFTLRVGLNVGPVVAGVIGTKKFSYDLWGDVVNIASRMESTGTPGMIQANENVKQVKLNFNYVSVFISNIIIFFRI